MPSALSPSVGLLLCVPKYLGDPGHPHCHLAPELASDAPPSAPGPRLRRARALWAGSAEGAAL